MDCVSQDETVGELWTSFFHAALQVKPVSLLFQHITDKLIEAVIKEEYKVATDVQVLLCL